MQRRWTTVIGKGMWTACFAMAVHGVTIFLSVLRLDWIDSQVFTGITVNTRMINASRCNFGGIKLFSRTFS